MPATIQNLVIILLSAMGARIAYDEVLSRKALKRHAKAYARRRLSNMPIALYHMESSIDGVQSVTHKENDSTTKRVIKTKEFKSMLRRLGRKLKNKSNNSEVLLLRVKDSIEIKSDKDLHLSFNKMSFKGKFIRQKKNNQYILSGTLFDDYNFDPKILETLELTATNGAAYILQKYGVIEEYPIKIQIKILHITYSK